MLVHDFAALKLVVEEVDYAARLVPTCRPHRMRSAETRDSAIICGYSRTQPDDLLLICDLPVLSMPIALHLLHLLHPIGSYVDNQTCTGGNQ